MIIDLATSDSNSVEETCEVCVIGAGAAGITLALEFEKLGVKTIVLEGGGYEFPSQGELDLYAAKLGNKSYPVATSRLRYLGGSTNHWGGWSRCLDSFDMSEKPYFQNPGWPIDKDQLMQYYPRAAEICEIQNLPESENQYYDNKLINDVFDWKKSGFKNKYFVFSPPTRFGTKYQPDLKHSTYVKTYLHANATQLLFSGNRVMGVKAQTLNGKRIKVNAKKIIVAMGGLENPRFMLNNKSQTFKKGVGNHADWLGRCFMDHPGFRPISLLLPKGLKYKRFAYQGQAVMPVISMTKEALLARQLNNFCIMLRQKQHDETINQNYAKNQWFNKGQSFANYDAQFIFEPSPCRDSRVTLTDDKDLLGMYKLTLDWQFNERDFRSVESVVNILISHLGTSHSGRIQWSKFFDTPNIEKITGGMHHAGTTRMSANESDGVVDSNCKVYQTEGLYVAGNSVFPHVGFSNPTVTLMALAIRLAAHIKDQLP